MIKNIKMNKQAMMTESGRSMVEMLGTLAIIGVLSIGGIAGYTYAMNKSKANDILDGVSRRALVVSQQMILGNTASLVEYKNKKIGDYEVTLDNTYGTGFFGIKVSGVEQAVCERLQDQWLSNAADIYLGDKYLDDATCAKENNDITYVFNDSLNADAVVSDKITITCDDSEKQWIRYYTGECCEVYHWEEFCPGDEPATCVKSSSACDCGDEECCDELEGSWGTDSCSEISLCCAEGEAKCGDCEGCICVPDGYDWMCVMGSCIACSPDEGKAVCPSDGECTCIPDGYDWSCDLGSCIACSPDEGEAVCSEYGYGSCLCVPPGYDHVCNDDYCVACPNANGVAPYCEGDDGKCACVCTDETCCRNNLGGSWAEGYSSSICCEDGTAVCPDDGECTCVSDGHSWACTSESCKVCSSEEGKATCGSSSYCTCVPDGHSLLCAEGDGASEECITCSPEQGKPLCAYFGGCICVPDGYDSECNGYYCKACSPEDGEAICSDSWGDCYCVPNGYSSACGYDNDGNPYCKICSPAEGTAICEDEGGCRCE